MGSSTLFPAATSGAARLRQRLSEPGVLAAPGCYDALSVRIVEEAGFECAFLGGFSVAAGRLGLPDVGLMSYGEMVAQTADVAAATSLPLIADADTGYGNGVNAQRSLLGYARAGAACVMIEDQAWPKRCGHTSGKEVVPRAEAIARVRAAAAVRDEHGLDILLMARTDAVATDGFDEALTRAVAFAEAGADITFLEAPESEEQMARYCTEVPGAKTANLVEDGRTPWLTEATLTDLGYSVVLYPVTMLLHSINAMQQAAQGLRSGTSDSAARVTFDDARALVGWPEYEERSTLYGTNPSRATEEETR
ncbi:MAG: 2-methylisocitrate lyase-like PEP mutase family enzyme [Candidatus Aldehydirespiratoraceae bacterium]|jgi:2-methylisocitrate lyase-like PEP mutase family enzyme